MSPWSTLIGFLPLAQVLIACGDLYVSPSTIKSHVKSIYRKLGVSSRKEAVERAHARELI